MDTYCVVLLHIGLVVFVARFFYVRTNEVTDYVTLASLFILLVKCISSHYSSLGNYTSPDMYVPSARRNRLTAVLIFRLSQLLPYGTSKAYLLTSYMIAYR